MKFKILISIVSVIVVSLPLLAQELSLTKQLDFTKATNDKSVVGIVNGFDSKRYEVKVKQNQTLKVDLESDSVYFNIYSPYKNRKNDALFVGKSQGKHFNTIILKAGVYIIRVYLRHNEAEQDIKRIFEMHVGLK